LYSIVPFLPVVFPVHGLMRWLAYGTPVPKVTKTTCRPIYATLAELLRMIMV